jgi:cbb3-type cytochrome oxidase maturation protein
MSALLYLIPISILLGVVALFTFLWTVKNGQYEDLEGAANRVLTDEDKPLPRNIEREGGRDE